MLGELCTLFNTNYGIQGQVSGITGFPYCGCFVVWMWRGLYVFVLVSFRKQSVFLKSFNGFIFPWTWIFGKKKKTLFIVLVFWLYNIWWGFFVLCIWRFFSSLDSLQGVLFWVISSWKGLSLLHKLICLVCPFSTSFSIISSKWIGKCL